MTNLIDINQIIRCVSTNYPIFSNQDGLCEEIKRLCSIYEYTESIEKRLLNYKVFNYLVYDYLCQIQVTLSIGNGIIDAFKVSFYDKKSVQVFAKHFKAESYLENYKNLHVEFVYRRKNMNIHESIYFYYDGYYFS